MKKFISKLVEYAFMLFLSVYLIKVSVCLLYGILPILAGILGIILLSLIIYRIVKHKRDNGEW